MRDLEAAWAWREKEGLLARTEAIRVFYGPGEGSGAWAQIAIDKFANHFWVTEWEGRAEKPLTDAQKGELKAFLESKGANSAVFLGRPQKDIAPEAVPFLGEPPAERFAVSEDYGGKVWIKLKGVRHPGLFLDHLPLRHWLKANSRGLRALNTFAYTGSLSVACGLGGAEHVTTLDLSRATVEWAEDNWKLNELDPARGRFIYGDVFEWLPRLKREGAKFDLVILDPPSFSRGKKGNFSTQKDLEKLHGLAMDLLAPGGFLITSINSANVSWKKYESDVQAAARARKLKFAVVSKFDLPPTFPTRPGRPEDRYLKGWILKS